MKNIIVLNVWGLNVNGYWNSYKTFEVKTLQTI